MKKTENKAVKTAKNATATATTKTNNATATATAKDVTAKAVEKAVAKATAQAQFSTYKNECKDYFSSYENMLKDIWRGFVDSNESGAKYVNNLIAGIAGGKGLKPYTYLIAYYTRYVEKGTRAPLMHKRGQYKRANLNGLTARTHLRNAVLNFIESNRPGNRFSCTEIEPDAIVEKFAD